MVSLSHLVEPWKSATREQSILTSKIAVPMGPDLKRFRILVKRLQMSEPLTVLRDTEVGDFICKSRRFRQQSGANVHSSVPPPQLWKIDDRSRYGVSHYDAIRSGQP
jgi:hypothetical protein